MIDFAGSVSLPSGITAGYHRLLRIELDPDGEQAIVDLASWGSAVAQQDGYAPEQQRVALPFSALAGAPAIIDAVKAALTGDGGPLTGAASLAPGDTLESLKQRQAALILAERNARELATFEWDGDEWYADSANQRRIIGVVLGAVIATLQSAPFEMTWKLASGGTRTLNAAEQMAMGMALLAHVRDLHEYERSLVELIEAAETPEAVQAIEWGIEP
jgi:hypothetical protein